MVSGRGVYSRPFCSMYILMNCCKDCKIMTLAAISEQNLRGHLVMLMIWHYCLLLCGDGRRLLIYVEVLCRNTQCNSIRRRLNVCVLEQMVNSLKVIYLDREQLKWVYYVRHFGSLITCNLKDGDDIQLKRGNFYGSVNNLGAYFKGILNNLDVASKNFVMHIVVLFMVLSRGTFLANHFIYALRGRKLSGGFINLPYRTHRYLLPYVVGFEHIRDNLINIVKNFFDSLMSSSNAIKLLVSMQSIIILLWSK